jgi:signal transduction histidine kinase
VSQRLQVDQLVIEVSDDGPGFNVESVSRERLGLACLRQRVEGVGGMFEIKTSRKGTCVAMTLKIKNEDEAAVWAA